MKRKIVPEIVKRREILSVSPDDKIIDVAAKMVDTHVAAVKMSLEEDVQETGAFVFGKQYGA